MGSALAAIPVRASWPATKVNPLCESAVLFQKITSASGVCTYGNSCAAYQHALQQKCIPYVLGIL